MGKKILIADDEPDIVKILKFRLNKEGYELIMAINGQEAIDLARQHKPQLIIMDFRMPILNGLEAVAIIKGDNALKDIPVILMTASSASVSQDIVEKSGVNELVRKPFEAEELIGIVMRLLNKPKE